MRSYDSYVSIFVLIALKRSQTHHACYGSTRILCKYIYEIEVHTVLQQIKVTLKMENPVEIIPKLDERTYTNE